MLRRLVGVFVALFIAECYCVLPPRGYFTRVGRERYGSGSGPGNRTDFRTWLESQRRDEDDGSAGSGDGDDDGEATPVPLDNDCDKMIDISFILDASESIGPIGFRLIKSYTKKIVNELDLSDCDNVGVIKFSDYVSSETFLGTRDTKSKMFARIDGLKDPEKLVRDEVNKSRIPLALFFADEFVFTRQLGSRPTSKKYIVLMTDGKQPEHGISNRSLTLEILVKRLTKKDINIMVVAIGENPSYDELAKFTKQRNIFPQRRFNDLLNHLVPKETHPNGLNNMATDFFVEEETQADEINSDNFGN
ncbi:matrilin-3-like [Dendronephthya gigantea]|uniref:matrilin-3-like n=1 Tax=Dendronephthya gigantea TaxID=151771 RepID=UPI00106BDD9D|nr:matrilin-3-like [Dendronephthya gigantea]XP_028413324.1 matrilin-3-like [Dendronephthya gigantea]